MTDDLHFLMSELIHSDTAVALNINNMPNIDHLDNMLRLIYYTLQPIRKQFGILDVTSGYRSSALNKALEKLGRNPAKNSQHLEGKAVDFIPRNKNIKEVFKWISKSSIPFDQLIYEYDSKGNVWIHISYNHKKNRKQVIDNYKGC